MSDTHFIKCEILCETCETSMWKFYGEDYKRYIKNFIKEPKFMKISCSWLQTTDIINEWILSRLQIQCNSNLQT